MSEVVEAVVDFRNTLSQGFAWDQFQYQKVNVIGVLKTVNRSNVGVIRRGKQLVSPSLLMQQHRYVIRALICGDEIGGTVGVQVSHRHRLGFVTHGEGLLGLEGAIAIAQ